MLSVFERWTGICLGEVKVLVPQKAVLHPYRPFQQEKQSPDIRTARRFVVSSPNISYPGSLIFGAGLYPRW
jgi:hypothetical protein